MTQFDLQRGNELTEKIKEITDNLILLDSVLEHQSSENCREKIKRFFLSCVGKNQIHIDAACIWFGGKLKVDRECMELLRDYFKNKLAEVQAEFESIGTGGDNNDT